MRRTLNDREVAYLKKLLADTVEPAINDIVTNLNEVLKSKNMAVGVELNWVLDSTEEAEEKTEG